VFNNLTYKKKFLAVILGFIILLLAAYKKTIRQTLAAKQELSLVQEQLANTNQSHNVLFSLQDQVKGLDNIIGGNNLKPELVQPSILNFITKKGQDVNVVSIEDVHTFLDTEFKIYSNQITVEGSYNKLIELLYTIEKEYKASRIVSTNLYSKKNYQTKTTKLYLKIILQNYEKNK
jgi:hypothetical protein